METKIYEKQSDVKKLFDVKANGQVIYWTKEIDKFNLVDGNRPKNENHVKALMKSIYNNGWLRSSLIVVGDKLKVYDGQHRLWALKQLKELHNLTYEIGYIVDRTLDLEKIRILNDNQRSWNPEDYIISNIKLGHKDYKIFYEIMKEFNLPYGSVLALIQDSEAGTFATKKFRNGELIIKDDNKLYEDAKFINSIKPYFKNYSTRVFVLAMGFFLKKNNFNKDEFINKLAQHRDLLHPVTNHHEYRKLIQFLYNYHRSEKNKVMFLQS